MSKLIEQYKDVKNNISEIHVETKKAFLIGLCSFILALLIISAPVAILINCLIFNDLVAVVIVGLVVCIYLLVFLARVFYFQTITENKVKNMKIYYLFDALVSLIFVIILCLFLLR